MRPEAEGFELAVKGKNEDWQIISVRPRSFLRLHRREVWDGAGLLREEFLPRGFGNPHSVPFPFLHGTNSDAKSFRILLLCHAVFLGGSDFPTLVAIQE